MNRRVVIAGAGGVLGGPMLRKVREEFDSNEVIAVDIKPLSEWVTVDSEVTNLVGDLRSRDLAKSICNGCSILLDLAGEVGNIRHIRSHKRLCYHAAEIHLVLLESAAQMGVSRFFFASSACVYPQSLQYAGGNASLSEDCAHPADPEPGYGWEKLYIEKVCEQYREDGLLNTTIGRMHNIYGPPSTYYGGKEKAPAALCRKVAEAKLSGSKSISVWGDGSQERTYLYIDDAIDAVWKLVKSDFGRPVNIGSDEKVSINKLIDEIEEVAGVKLEKEYQEKGGESGVSNRGCDLTLIRDKVGWTPKTSLRDGLRVNFNWIMESLRNA